MEPGDELIIEGIRNHRSGVLREFYKTHYPMIQNLIIFNSGTEQEAKDVYQETVIAFYEKVQQDGFKLTCRIATYLYAVGRRIWLKRLAEKKIYSVKVREGDVVDNIDDEMELLEKKERDFAAMGNALNELGQPCQALLEAYYFKGTSMDDLTIQFGYTNSDNAKNQKYKCLQRLKKIFFGGKEL